MMERPCRISVRHDVGGQTIISVETWRDWSSFDEALLCGEWHEPTPRSVIAVTRDSAPALPLMDGRLFELQHIKVHNGRGTKAMRQVTALWVPVLETAGANCIIPFEVVHGDSLPAILLLLAWPDMASAARAFLAVESDPNILAELSRLRMAGEPSAIIETRRHLSPAIEVIDRDPSIRPSQGRI